VSALGPGKSLVVVGASHRTAEIAAREAVGVPKERLKPTLETLRALDGVDGVCVVSTCNRTEVLASGKDADVLERALREALFAPRPWASSR
jgi:glutamyl-tRNA reductase